MPSIDLARLRKQALRLAEFFYVPDEFARQLTAVLDKYVDYSNRDRTSPSRASGAAAQRAPNAVMKHIEQELAPLASAAENVDATLTLADRLWDDGGPETRLLAAFLLGRIAPSEAPLVARLTAWLSQAESSDLRSNLVDLGLTRARKEAPEVFLHTIEAWLRSERAGLVPDALRACTFAVNDPAFRALPSLLQVLEPALKEAPGHLQFELEQLILALYAVAPNETSFFVKQVVRTSHNSSTAVTFRRMLPALPAQLGNELREYVRRKSSVSP